MHTHTLGQAAGPQDKSNPTTPWACDSSCIFLGSQCQGLGLEPTHQPAARVALGGLGGAMATPKFVLACPVRQSLQSCVLLGRGLGSDWGRQWLEPEGWLQGI